MMRSLVLFEDRHWAGLRPLTELLPVPALAFGGSNLAARWRAVASIPLRAVEARARVLAVWRERPGADVAAGSSHEAGGDGEVLVVNAAALPGPWLDTVRAANAPALFTCGDRIAAARLPLEQIGRAHV